MVRKAEELIVASEKRFRALIENSADMITLSTIDGVMLYGSSSITKQFGYTVDEIPQTLASSFVHPDDIQGFLEKRNEMIKAPGNSFYNQQRLRHKNGTWIWCEVTLTNMLDEPGIHAIVSNFRDISEKKIAEQQREFDRNNLDALINNTDDLMWSVDRETRLITFNRPFYDTIKRVSGKEIKKGDDVFSVVLSREQFERFKLFYQRALAGESFTEIEYISTPVEFWSEISYHPIRKGDEVVGTACYSRDVTKIKKTEQQVIINENRYRALVENGADAVVILTAEAKPFYVSPNVEKLLGYTESETMELDLFSMFHPDDIKLVIKVWEQVLISSGLPHQISARMIHKDGAWRWFEGTLNNLLHDPSVNGVVNNFRDVTEKKLAEETLLLTQLAIENSGDAVFWMTSDARIIKVNEAACNMLGYAEKDILALSIPDIDLNYDAKM